MTSNPVIETVELDGSKDNEARHIFLIDEVDAKAIAELQKDPEELPGSTETELYRVEFTVPDTETRDRVVLKLHPPLPGDPDKKVRFGLTYWRGKSLQTQSVFETGPDCPYDRIWWPDTEYSTTFTTAWIEDMDARGADVEDFEVATISDEDNPIISTGPTPDENPHEEMLKDFPWKGLLLGAAFDAEQTRNLFAAYDSPLIYPGGEPAKPGDVRLTDYSSLVLDELSIRIDICVAQDKKVRLSGGRFALTMEAVVNLIRYVRDEESGEYALVLAREKFDLNRWLATDVSSVVTFDHPSLDLTVELLFDKNEVCKYRDNRDKRFADKVLNKPESEQAPDVIVSGSHNPEHYGSSEKYVAYCLNENVRAVTEFLRTRGVAAGHRPSIIGRPGHADKRLLFDAETYHYQTRLLDMGIISTHPTPDKRSPVKLVESLVDRLIICKALLGRNATLPNLSDKFMELGYLDWLVAQLEELALDVADEARWSSGGCGHGP